MALQRTLYAASDHVLRLSYVGDYVLSVEHVKHYELDMMFHGTSVSTYSAEFNI